MVLTLAQQHIANKPHKSSEVLFSVKNQDRLHEFQRFRLQDTVLLAACIPSKMHQQPSIGVIWPPESVCSSLLQILQHLQAIDLLSPLPFQRMSVVALTNFPNCYGFVDLKKESLHH